MCVGDIGVWQRHIGLHRKHLRGEERGGHTLLCCLRNFVCVILLSSGRVVLFH